MAEIQPFEVWRQRAALTQFADTGLAFLETAEGAAFLEQIALVTAPAILAKAREAGYSMERQDVVNLVVERLISTSRDLNDAAPIRYAAAAENPWGYLWTTALRWARAEWGTRAFGLEETDRFIAPTLHDDTSLTPLAEVVRLTFNTLARRTNESYHADLLELLGWLAANPPQRISYEGQDGIAAHRHCPGLSIGQVTAVMNIAWGGRPRQAQTSLMGQFLVDADWDPASSHTHMRALVYFQTVFRAASNGSRTLADWTVSGRRAI